MKRLWLISAVACALGACGSNAAPAPAASESQPTAALCDAAAHSTTDKPALLQELLRRHAIKDEHLAQIRDGKVVNGMNSCETIAAWGPPLHFSNTPGMDYRAYPSVAGASMVYDYETRGKIGLDANGLVIAVSR